MREFTLKQLRYFVVAGQLSSVTQAARKLHVSQPSISAAIQQMEETTGMQLFVRHHAQGLTLTPLGQQLFARARRLLDDAEGLSQFAASLGDAVRGELRMVALPTFAPVFLPQLLRRFSDRYPEVSLFCDEMTQADIFRGLDESDYELAFTYDLGISENIAFTPLYRFPPYAVVAEDHPLAGRDQIALAELVAYSMVLLDWSLSREYFLSIFARHGVTPTVTHRVKSMDMLRGLVAAGFGFALFNTPMQAFEAQSTGGLKALALTDEAESLSMGIARQRNARLTPAAEAMYELAADSADQAGIF
ncbi:LysR family transcriptional regulator [Salinisphaera sp. SPP-AMP-43]|uniref:LysR family transcriptional regulator n=1 Tax=Salinisphaera sp. SPP-AMP-43 TaxID=3121288 RepID=UPI003C6E8D34